MYASTTGLRNQRARHPLHQVEQRRIYGWGLAPAPPWRWKMFVLIFNVKKKFYAKIWTLLKMYTWNVSPPPPLQISKLRHWSRIICHVSVRVLYTCTGVAGCCKGRWNVVIWPVKYNNSCWLYTRRLSAEYHCVSCRLLLVRSATSFVNVDRRSAVSVRRLPSAEWLGGRVGHVTAQIGWPRRSALAHRLFLSDP